MIVEVNNISKSFGSKKVLDEVSFGLEKGTINGLVGRNGSGKTSLLKILSGIYKQDSGSFMIMGESLNKKPDLIKHIGFLPDRFDYFNYYKAKDIPDFYRVIYEDFDIDYFFKKLNENSIDPNQNIRTLSKGSKNLIGLITILASKAELLFVDEILDGMDVLNKDLIISLLLDAKDRGRTILASSHELDILAGLCENIIYLSKDGRLKSANLSESNIKKVQIVVKDRLKDELRANVSVLSSLGRVHVVLVDESLLKSYLSSPEIVQYDLLNLKIEDYFYLEKGGKNV